MATILTCDYCDGPAGNPYYIVNGKMACYYCRKHLTANPLIRDDETEPFSAPETPEDRS